MKQKSHVQKMVPGFFYNKFTHSFCIFAIIPYHFGNSGTASDANGFW